MYLLPLGVTGKGLTKLIPIFSKGFPTGIGCKGSGFCLRPLL
jgi:hypothetical protein